MKVLLFGGSGQLGQEVLLRAKDLNFNVVYPSLHELNITEQAQVEFLINQVKPQVVLNCAAYTAVDQAEAEKDLCFSINRDGARYIAQAATKLKARVVHISTDYVFAGDGDTPLKENDPTEPKSVYGLSKLEGEKAVMEETDGKAAIVRTASLHGKFGNNFVHTMLSLFDKKTPVSVVSDQFMSPCWAGFLAEALLDIIRIEFTGILHCSGSGAVSWYDFAQAIAEYTFPASEQPVINPTSIEEFARPAPRPRFSAFDLNKFTAVLGRKPITWQDGLKFHLQQIERLQKAKKRGLL